MASIPPKAREAIELARRGELARAILSGEAALAETPDDGPLQLFIGLLHARRLDLHRALPHLRQAADLIPGDPLPRLERARALVGTGRHDEAEATLGEDITIAAARVRALILERRGRHGEAAALHRAAIATDACDFESWGRLGFCLFALGDAAGAAAALARSLALSPDQPAVRARLAEAQAAAGKADAALEAARAQARTLPYDPLVRVTIARLEDLLGRPRAAEATLGEALTLDPGCAPALIALAELIERANRIDEVEPLMARAMAVGVPPAETALLRARLLLRRGEIEAALATARSAPEAADGGARAELIGRSQDRLGEHREAFAAFAAMNQAAGAGTAASKRMAEDYRAMIRSRARVTTPNWHRAWATAAPPTERPSPVFLLGFPRSGTTLIDTMLAGHPQVAVIEEKPALHAAARALGPFERLAELGEEEIAALRRRYFDALDAIEPRAQGRLVIDKLPLGIVDLALIHRLFPDARILFAERHPCDVILSGFMTRFDPRGAMANFLDLRDLAALYDLIMSYWVQCRALFRLETHSVRYERVIEDPEAELRPLCAFLGLAWDERLLDHRASAGARGHIGTPSYAQVAAPLYTGARGRWERYRAELGPVLPLLAPWCEAMGYALPP